MAKPIFIVGTNRSGTTWLGNLLASHSQVAAITHTMHQGVHESAYFTHVYERYGDLKHKVNYLEFVEAIGSSDYFRLAEISKNELFELYPTDYGKVFRYVMDRFASKNKRKFWIEKSPNHALKMELISKLYPDAVFIAIQRDVYDVVKSSLGLRIKYVPDRKNDSILRKNTIKDAIFNYYKVNKTIKQFKKKHPDKIFICSFEDLKLNKQKVLNEIVEFTGLTVENIDSTVKPNTSFENKEQMQEKNDLFIPSEKSLLKRRCYLMNSMPLLYFNVKAILRDKLRKRFTFCRNPKLPNWFYKLHEFNN